MNENLDHIKLTASELSYLWTSYLADSMSVCVLKYFLVHIDDNDIKSLTTSALQLSEKHVEFIRGIFTKEQIQIPQGFTEQDVNLSAKRLFSDIFYLRIYSEHVKGRFSYLWKSFTKRLSPGYPIFLC